MSVKVNKLATTFVVHNGCGFVETISSQRFPGRFGENNFIQVVYQITTQRHAIALYMTHRMVEELRTL